MQETLISLGFFHLIFHVAFIFDIHETLHHTGIDIKHFVPIECKKLPDYTYETLVSSQDRLVSYQLFQHS